MKPHEINLEELIDFQTNEKVLTLFIKNNDKLIQLMTLARLL